MLLSVASVAASLPSLSSTLSSRLMLTIVTACSRVRRKCGWISYNAFKCCCTSGNKNSKVRLILSRISREDLHWLDVPDRITFKLCVSLFKCLHGLAPSCLSNLCRPLANDEGCRHQRFAARGQLQVPRSRLSTYGKRAFAFCLCMP